VEPAYPALAVTVCWALGFWAVRLIRDPGPLAALRTAQVDVVDMQPQKRRGPITALTEWLGRLIAPRMIRLFSDRGIEKIRAKLDSAGKPGSMTVEDYVGRRAAFAALLGGICVPLFFTGRAVIPPVMAAVGWFMMDIWLGSVARDRQREIERQLPDFLDVLAITVGAGVAFRAALARVSEALGGALAEEIMTSLRQMELGASRRDAFIALRQRNHSESLSQFVTSLLQAEELGVPLGAALAALADDMRRASYQEARRRAQRAAPRVSLYVSGLIVPASVILIAAAILLGSDFSLGEVFGS
jgi:tight adherence protein C